MNDFLLDLWHDLREKRLWPVAVLLGVALVLIPVVLAKPAESPDPPAARVGAAPHKASGEVRLRLADLQSGKGSTLDLYHTKNPFLPPTALIKRLEAPGDAGSSATAGEAPGSTPPGTSGADEAGGAGGGESAGGGAPGGGSPAGDAPSADAPTGSGGRPKVTRYAYVADVTFWVGRHGRRYEGMRRLRMLPSEESPLLLFLGVDSTGDNAVFLIDSTLEARGEGRCSPSGKECSLLSIGPGSEEEFRTGSGRSYTLRIDEIRKVRLTSRARGHAARHRRRRARVGSARVTGRRFVAPILTDLVTVATPGTGR
jgi:hypothetical protein